LLLAAQPAEPDCGRYRSGSELQPCEFEHDDRADILEAAQRPLVLALGADVVRFSTRPQLGGDAAVIEIVGNRHGGAVVRIFTFVGHWRTSWEPVAIRSFQLSSAEYRRLANRVDDALARYRPSVEVQNEDGTREAIVCTDGPGYLTERVRDGRVTTLVGFCPPVGDEEHSNRRIADVMMAMICRHIGRDIEVDLYSGLRCSGS
jgi:hypothetical protein